MYQTPSISPVASERTREGMAKIVALNQLLEVMDKPRSCCETYDVKKALERHPQHIAQCSGETYIPRASNLLLYFNVQLRRRHIEYLDIPPGIHSHEEFKVVLIANFRRLILADALFFCPLPKGSIKPSKSEPPSRPRTAFKDTSDSSEHGVRSAMALTGRTPYNTFTPPAEHMSRSKKRSEHKKHGGQKSKLAENGASTHHVVEPEDDVIILDSDEELEDRKTSRQVTSPHSDELQKALRDTLKHF